MAGLPWIRLQTTIFENPKVLNLKEDKQWRAVVAYLEMMTYSGRHGLAGFVPKSAIRQLHITQGDVQRIASERLISPAPGGWEINSWDEFQLADPESLARSEKAKKAAAARWAKRNGRNDEIA